MRKNTSQPISSLTCPDSNLPLLYSPNWEYPMRIARGILGGLLVLIGAVWFLQGINVLPGSFMTRQTRWAVYGGIAVVAGAGVLWTAKHRPTR